MKKIFLPIVVCLATAFNANAVDAGNANIYASGLKVSESGNSVQFIVNAPGTATIKFYKAGEQVLKIEGKEVIKGVNVVDLAYIFPETVKAGDELTWDVTLKADANESINGFSTYASKVAELSGGGTNVSKDDRNNVNETIWKSAGAEVADVQKMEYPYSVAVDKNPTSPNFGNIYVLNDAGQSYGSIERESGLYVYDSNLNLLNTTPYTEGLNIGNEYYNDELNVPVSPYAVSVDEDGNVFISSGSVEEGGIYVAMANDISKFNKLIDTPEGMTFQDLVITGKGENKTLWVLNKQNSSLYKSVIGLMTADNYSLEQVCSLLTASEYVSSGNVANAFTSYPARMCSDKKGGFWVIEGNNQNIQGGYYWLNHINANGILDFGAGDYWGSFATTEPLFKLSKKSYDIDTNTDGSQLTIAICGSAVPFTISFNETNGVPSLGTISTSDPNSYIYGALANTSPYGRWGSSLHPVTNGVAYDIADNLYITDLSGYFQAFALPKADNSYTTAANDKLVVTGGLLTDVESIIVDENALVEYFNMQGVKVNAPENGIFIKKQAGKTSKVIL